MLFDEFPLDHAKLQLETPAAPHLRRRLCWRVIGAYKAGPATAPGRTGSRAFSCSNSTGLPKERLLMLPPEEDAILSTLPPMDMMSGLLIAMRRHSHSSKPPQTTADSGFPPKRLIWNNLLLMTDLGKDLYDVIVVFFYLHRSLFPLLMDALSREAIWCMRPLPSITISITSTRNGGNLPCA